MQRSALASSPRPPRAPLAPDPRVLRPVRQIALAGLALVLVWPAARGYSQWLGWWPLWLLGMPMTAWWALYRFRLPVAAATGGVRPAVRRRRQPQARRRAARARLLARVGLADAALPAR